MCAHTISIDTHQSDFDLDVIYRDGNQTDQLANDSIDDGTSNIGYQDYDGTSSQHTRETRTATRRLVLLPFTGHDEVSLKGNINALANKVDTYHLSDLAYTLASHRSHLNHRAFEVVDARLPSISFDPGNAKFGKPGSRQQDVGFVFTGNYLNF